MSGQKNPLKKSLTGILWITPALGVSIAAALFLFTIARTGQAQTTSTRTLQTILQLEQALLSLLPQPVIDPTTDPPGNFTNVIPQQFDPGKTNLVQATWLSGIGCPTGAFTFDGSTTTPLTDTACPVGDPKDQRNQGLLLVKTGPTPNFAAATAELINVKGISLTELGYDIRKSGVDEFSPLGSHCGAGAPRFDVVLSDGSIRFVGCSSFATLPVVTAASGAWIRLRWFTPIPAFPTPILATDVVQRIVIVFDEGTDTGPDFFGAAFLDNIDVNGSRVGRGPVAAN